MAVGLVIVHGFSSSADQFDNLAARLREANPALDIATIRLGDYVTLDDDVTIADLRTAMQAAWTNQGLPTGARSVDVILHSLGALVVRDWMTTFFKPDSNPIKRLVMLAPANFGSPLAVAAQSTIGRVIKGFHLNNPGQIGTLILKSLEVAGPYTLNLALRDRFDPNNIWYGKNRVLCTVLVGTAGYKSIAAIANTPGGDGTVLVSTANLNPYRIENIDFTGDPNTPIPVPAVGGPLSGPTAFVRIPNEDHGSIAQGGSADTFKRIVQALQIQDQGFEQWCTDLEAVNVAVRAQEANADHTHGFQNTVFHLTDNLGQSVMDYVLEAYVPKTGINATVTAADVDDDATTRVQQEIINGDPRVCTIDASYRASLFDCTKLTQILTDANRVLELSITAHPQVSDKSAGYESFGFAEIAGLALDPNAQSVLFQPDRTLFVDMTIQRVQQGIFSFRSPNPVDPVVP